MTLTKESLKEFLTKRYDVNLDEMVAELGIEHGEMQNLEKWLDELIQEKWIRRSEAANGFEYDPGEAQPDADIGMN